MTTVGSPTKSLSGINKIRPSNATIANTVAEPESFALNLDFPPLNPNNYLKSRDLTDRLAK